MGYLENIAASLDGKRIAFIDAATARTVTVSIQAGLDGTATNIDGYLTPAFSLDASKIKFGHTFKVPSGATGRNLAQRLKQVIIRLDSNQPLVQLGSASVGYWLSGPGQRIENVRWEFYDLLNLLGHNEPGMVREIVGGVWTGQMIPGTVRVPAPCTVATDAAGATLTIDVSGLTFAAGQTINLDPIARTGSPTLAGYTRTNTGTYTITVPADAEIIVVGVTGYYNTANYFTGGGMTCTKGASDIVMSEVAQGNASTSYFMGAMFYLVSPDTGASKSLKWDWSGTGTPDNGVPCVYAFYKGIDTSSPVRDSDGAQGADGATTPTLTAQSGDLIVAWGWNYRTDMSGQTPAFTGVTNVGESEEFNLAYVDADTRGCGMWGEGSPTGNQTVQYDANPNNDGGVCAIVLQPAGAPPAGGNPYYAYAQQ